MKIKGIILIFTLLLIVAAESVAKSVCKKEEDVWGSGKFPHNFRVIDDKLYAGGSFFNPEHHGNSTEKVRSYIKLLKSMGVTSVIALNSPASEEEKIVKEEGLIFYSCPECGKVPNSTETIKFMELIDKKAYIPVNGAQTEQVAVIAKYYG
jgi:hypothetical protein